MKLDKTISQQDFEDIMMSVIHEVKNSLLISSSTLEAIAPELPDSVQDNINKIESELECVNESLMRLLTLYKMRTDHFSLNKEQHNLYDFIEEIMLTNQAACARYHVHLEIDCDEYLEGYFDYFLITNTINTVINNTMRYAKKIIVLEARETDDNMLQINIIDDGPGYPDFMLKTQEAIRTGIDFEAGKTGLGLYFCEKIANLHCRGTTCGYTKISNLEQGGGCFSLYLP